MDDEQPRIGRPQSTVAQSFATDLDSIFGLSNSGGLATLSQTVEEKKANVTSGQSELEKLEAKLRETEQRLAKVSRHNSPSRPVDSGAETSPPREAERQAHPLSHRPKYPDDRPPTGARPQTGQQEVEAGMPGMPGAMPASTEQLNGNGREDYVLVDNERER